MNQILYYPYLNLAQDRLDLKDAPKLGLCRHYRSTRILLQSGVKLRTVHARADKGSF